MNYLPVIRELLYFNLPVCLLNQLLFLGESQFQDPVFMGGMDLLLINGIRKLETPFE